MGTPFTCSLMTSDALQDAKEQQLSQGGLFIPSAERPALFAPIELNVELPDTTLETKAQVVNLTPHGFYILLEADTLQQVIEAVNQSITALEAAATKRDEGNDALVESEGSSPEVTGDESADNSATKGPLRGTMTPVWELIDSASDVPLHRQIGKLTVNDKLRLARQANRPVRRILIRDVEKRIHLEVIKNPQVQDDELMEYASISGLSPNALEWMARQSRLMKNKRMVLKLVTNTGTPPQTAKKLLDRLTNRELVRVVRSPRAREALVREARRRLMKAGIL